MGIRQKIRLGFLSLAALLFFSGMISYLELNRFSSSNQSMLDASFRNMELSKNMLDGVQDQNTALLQMIIVGRNPGNDSLWNAGRDKFDSAIMAVRTAVRYLPGIDSIYDASQKYDQIISDHFASPQTQEDMEWFSDMYKTSYNELTSSIKNMMLTSQTMIDVKARQLERNAYRAIRPGIIALVIAIIIILLFFYFIDIYYIRPVLKITKGLGNYLNLKIPFKVTFEGRDEVVKLKEYIEDLLNKLNGKKEE